MKGARRFLFVYPAHGPTNDSADADKIFIAAPLKSHGVELQLLPVPLRRRFISISRKLLFATGLNACDLHIATEYALIFAVSMRRELTGARAPVVGVGLNQARRAFVTGAAPIDRWINRRFQAIDCVIVHSRHERTLFNRLHGIELNRIHFAHWGYDLPAGDSRRFADRSAPYVCMIGRNNRDVDAFCAAAAAAGIDGVVIGPQPPSSRFPNIEFHGALSPDDCQSCIQHSIANVILLKDDERGAGHITAVTGMHLGRPTIYSRTESLIDYLIDGYNGIAVPLGDVEKIASAFSDLAASPARAHELGENGRRYAARWLSNDVTAKRIADLVLDVYHGRSSEIVRSDWLAEYDGLTSASTFAAAKGEAR
ncbi:MAG: hypothetical protein GC152_16280 [Alphaproteobacteria bacterium]|nr:hypothetical protein [Alphaproteobacteria bacterium]